MFQHGVYDGLAHWLTFYLVIACTGIAVAGHLRSIAQMQSEAQTLKMKNELVLDSYHAIECSVQQTASMRHELKKHITAMNLMYQQKKLEELGHYLEKLDTQQTQLSQTQFTDNFMINAILQNAAAEAAEIGVRFEAHAVTPQELFIDEGDLCSFLMNMLDNAMEACQLIPAQNARFIRFRIELKNGFLAISCINSYIGRTVKDDNGRLKTTKPDQTIHGFGLRQMSAIAEKYHSIVDISYTNDVFTVQTALQLKEKS